MCVHKDMPLTLVPVTLSNATQANWQVKRQAEAVGLGQPSNWLPSKNAFRRSDTQSRI
jgi:hypothetical protein